MTYPVDFRMKVLDAKQKQGLTDKEAAELFGIGTATIGRWKTQLEPQRHRNKLPTKIHTDLLLKDVADYPDAYLQERAARLQATKSGIYSALKRLNISRKKTLSHTKANPVLRQLFNERITNYKKQGKTIVYIDESGFESDMSRPYGYAHIGQKCAGKSDWHSKKRINAIGAITDFFLITVTLFAGSINSEVFFQWVIQDLLPKLPESCVIVMDNATFHKRLDIQHAIKANGHLLEYLPVYSPDLNPIEHYWAKVKAIRRKEQCTVEDLFAHKI